MGASDSQRANAPERRCRKNQRGIATVELAIAVPVLLLLMMASAEAGRWLYQYNTLHKAVRDGVRYSAQEAITGTTGAVDITIAIRNATRNVVLYGNPAGTGNRVLQGLGITQIKVNPVGGVYVSVEVGAANPYYYDPMFFDLGFPLHMTASATMRAL